jgi:putative cell wall-binding protein
MHFPGLILKNLGSQELNQGFEGVCFMKKVLKGIVAVGLSASLFLSLPGFAMGAGSIPMSTALERLYGVTQYETATRIADEIAELAGIDFAKGDKFENVVLASGNNYPDALAGGPLANQEHAPILLVDRTPAESTHTLEYIKEHVDLTGNVYLLGGKAVIPTSFTDALKDMGFAAENIHQLGGYDKNETSLIIAEMVANPLNEVVLVRDSNFYDALTVSSVTTSALTPILLVSDSGLSPEQKSFCDQQEHVIAVGELTQNIGKIYPRAFGVSGNNRYDTNALWNIQSKNKPFIILATGENFPDALAGTVLAGGLGAAPIYLTKTNELPKETEAALKITSYYNKQAQTITTKDGQMVSIPPIVYPTVYVLGGHAVVSTEVINNVLDILNGPGIPLK